MTPYKTSMGSCLLTHRNVRWPRRMLNRVPASAWGKGEILTTAGWQVTLCDPIWHVSFP